MEVFVVVYNDQSGEGDRQCGVFDSPETAEYYISKQMYSWYYNWNSVDVLTMTDLD